MHQIASLDPTWSCVVLNRLLDRPTLAAEREVEGVILCAGTGARMAPLTNKVPKPLLPALNCPLALWNILLMSGTTKIVSLNTHHLSGLFAPLVPIAERAHMLVRCVREQSLSGPFGGVLSCFRSRSMPRDVIVLAGDGFFQANLPRLLRMHRERDADLTMGIAAVADGSRYGVLSLDDAGRVAAMREKPPNVGAVAAASCGAYVVSHRVWEKMPSGGVLDWIDVVTTLLHAGRPIFAEPVELWLDAGTPTDLVALNLRLLGLGIVETVADRVLHPDACVWTQGLPPSLKGIEVRERVLIGGGATIEAGVSLTNVVVGTGAHIGRGAILKNALVMPGAHVPTKTQVNGTVCS